VLHNRESEARAAHVPRTGAVDAVEALEQSLQVLCRNSVAIVAHKDLVARSRLVSDGNSSTITTELDPVIDQVREHLLEPSRIGKHGHFRCDVVA